MVIIGPRAPLVGMDLENKLRERNIFTIAQWGIIKNGVG